MATTTPWGLSQSKKTITRGINCYSTAGHGGYKVSDKLNQQIPAYMRNADGWYEEDCEWAIVVIVFSNLFSPEDYIHAEKTLRNTFPDAYEKFFNITLEPGQSHSKDERLFYEANKQNWLACAAWGDWHEKIPAGMVGVVATQGLDRTQNRIERFFLVPSERYQTRRFSYVIHPEDIEVFEHF